MSDEPVYHLLAMYQAYRNLTFLEWFSSTKEQELRKRLYTAMRIVSANIDEALGRTKGFYTYDINYAKACLTEVESYANKWAKEC